MEGSTYVLKKMLFGEGIIEEVVLVVVPRLLIIGHASFSKDLGEEGLDTRILELNAQ